MHHPPLEAIATRLLEHARCAEQDLDLCSHIASAVLSGKPFTPTVLASSLSTNQHDLSQRLARLPGVEFDHRGRILGWGFTLVPTSHQVRIGGKQLFAWCAFDTIQFPPALHVEAQIHSTCPVTGAPIQFVVTTEGEIQDLTEAQARLSLLIPEHCVTSGNTRLIVPEHDGKGEGIPRGCPAFCEQSLFFQSEEAASTFLTMHPQAMLLSLEEAAQLARLITQHCV
jgi:alkylmercury lyase